MVRNNPKEICKRGWVPKNGSVLFTLYQTCMFLDFDLEHYVAQGITELDADKLPQL